MREKPEEFYLFSDMDLLLCPICGAKAKPIVSSFGVSSFDVNGEILAANFYIKCGNEKCCVSSPNNYRICFDAKSDGGITVSQDDREKAQSAWNKRNGVEPKSEIKSLEQPDISLFKKPEFLPCPICGEEAKVILATDSCSFNFGVRCGNNPPCVENKSTYRTTFDVFTDGRVLVRDGRKQLRNEWNTRYDENQPNETKNRSNEEQAKIQKSNKLLEEYYTTGKENEESSNFKLNCVVYGILIAIGILFIAFVINNI